MSLQPAAVVPQVAECVGRQILAFEAMNGVDADAGFPREMPLCPAARDAQLADDMALLQPHNR